MTVALKDILLLFRDRARLTTLLAMPIIFVGIQIFAAAGLELSREKPARLALLIYSMCAYLGVIGPLAHMQAERKAFWLLRSVPVSLSRIMLHKVLAWSVFMGGMGMLAYVGLGYASWGAQVFAPGSLAMLGLVLLGAVLASALGIAMGCNTADLSKTGRSAVGLTTAYTFLLLAGLYNMMFVDTGAIMVRGLGLFVAAVLAYWATGMKRAAESLDPESVADRDITPGQGVAAAILLYLGARATTLGAGATGMSASAVAAAAGVWAVLIGGVVGVQLVVRWWRSSRKRGVIEALLFGLVAAVLVRVALAGSMPPETSLSLLLVGLAEELVFRGSFQGALITRMGRTTRATLSVLVLTTTVSLLATATPWSTLGVAMHLTLTCLRFAGGGVLAPLLLRVALTI